MGFIRNSGFMVLLLLSWSCLEFSTAIDNITTAQIIKDTETIVSPGGNLKLGFFSPENSTYRYVGIWFTLSVKTVIWVANRDNPVMDSSGILAISEFGNLVVMNGLKEIFWSSNISSAANVTAQLLDSGNLVLHEVKTGGIIWASFEHPSDTCLPNMKLTTNVRTGEKQVLSSWKSPSDPSIGRFSYFLDPLSIPEVFILNDNHTYWRSGPWDNRIFIGILSMNSVYLDGFSIVDDKEGSFYIIYDYIDHSSMTNFVLTSEGQLNLLFWDDQKENWEVAFRVPETQCDVYGNCGAFGICNMQNSHICSCLKGFEPKIKEEWNTGNWTSGCVRRTPLQCEGANSGGKQKEDGFLMLKNMKVPDFTEWSSANEEECKNLCLNNCSCMAYSYYTGMVVYFGVEI